MLVRLAPGLPDTLVNVSKIFVNFEWCPETRLGLVVLPVNQGSVLIAVAGSFRRLHAVVVVDVVMVLFSLTYFI